MKGELAIDREEIQEMVKNHLSKLLIATGTRITEIGTDSYSSYSVPTLKVKFTDDPEEKEGE